MEDIRAQGTARYERVMTAEVPDTVDESGAVVIDDEISAESIVALKAAATPAAPRQRHRQPRPLIHRTARGPRG
ncbi:hypothetical protein BB31_34940 [Amycolatopsis lurida NRRL 2430]|uniref:Uncharacterized protein n=1 Tax=Amycolatopsis lurida NRRL 2430 TaxID=1460371 RepID=A0A2P2FIT5_AMYLU|nr:hypothetical protein BB31_34940 [Amycolatopsis lurida NRRL 2430]